MDRFNIFGVKFNPEEHRYFIGEQELSGITSVLNKYISSGKYDNVPAGVLERARERGTKVHADISLWINGYREDLARETKVFAEWAGDKELFSECIVSDGISFASCVDVAQILPNKRVKLYDIKTTHVIDEDYCRWQLSIYAYFVELAGLGVDAISVLHIKDGQIKEIPMPIIDEQHVQGLLKAAAAGEPWNNPFVGTSLSEAQVKEICFLEKAVKDFEEQRKYYESKLNEFKESMLEYMNANNLTKIETERVIINRKKASQRATLDTKALKAEHPELAEKYTKVTEIKESLIIKTK